MAVSDNLGLYLPTREDYISVTRDITNNMTNIDGAVGGIMGGSLIVCDGDTHIAITSGQYVHVRNNAHGLTEGWYTANTNIAANAQIDSTNCDPAPSEGILNSLNGKFTPSGYSTTGLSYSSGVSWSQGGYVLYGNLCVVQLVLSITANKAQYDSLFAGLPKPVGLTGGGNPANAGSSNTALENVAAGLRGFASSAISSGATVRVFTVYIANI